MWHNVANIPSFVPRAIYVPAGSRNPPASISAGRVVPAGSRNPPASVLLVVLFLLVVGIDQHLFLLDNPHKNKDLGIIDSGCSRSMAGNKEKLDDFVKIIGGTITFGGGDGKINGKGTIRPIGDHLKPFGCLVTILNTSDSLGKI
ncbi:hypothetical protein Tco_1003837 [Tanacetum coccineum]|uniref:Uncharacterized protein n=1 Tax=Tanacetum coccineum TaxID=301880 RepID=A0ABQ5FBB7_9ASTR